MNILRHRLTEGIYTGLGNPSAPILNNVWSKKESVNDFIKTMGDDAISLYFKDIGGFDFDISEDSITLGIEPAYKYDKLKLIHLEKNKDNCYYQTGIAFGYYGSDILSNTRYYKNYKKKCKFKDFIDKWYEEYYKILE